MNFDNNPDLIPFEVKFSLVETLDVNEVWNDSLEEGIDVSKSSVPGHVDVSYNPTHDGGVDSNPAHNPTSIDLNASKVSIDPKYITVYAVLQRVDMLQTSKSIAVGSDGNPILYAFKNEKGYTFKSDADREAVKSDIIEILGKFIDKYFSEISGDVVTVVVPSGNTLNTSFTGWFKHIAHAKGKNIVVYDGVFSKISTEVVRDEVLDDARSEFNQWIASLPVDKGWKIKKQLLKDLDTMDKLHSGTFSYHFVRDPEIRNHLSKSMTLSQIPATAEEFSPINDKNVILIDDSVSRGASLKEAYSLLVDTYHPKTVTGLVLFSPKK